MRNPALANPDLTDPWLHAGIQMPYDLGDGFFFCQAGQCGLPFVLKHLVDGTGPQCGGILVDLYPGFVTGLWWCFGTVLFAEVRDTCLAGDRAGHMRRVG